MSRAYTEIEIHIQQAQPGTEVYPVEARLDDGAPFSGRMRLDRTALLELEHEGEDAAYGLALFKTLFSGDIGRAYNEVVGRAQATSEGRVRVRLWIDRQAAELHDIRWERLTHRPTEQAIVLSAGAKTPFSRYLGVALPSAPPVAERPLRILIAIANPQNLPPGLHALDVEQEIENLHRALGGLQSRRTFAVTILPGRSGLSEALRKTVAANRYKIEAGNTTRENLLRLLPDFHVLHFVGHGQYKHGAGKGPDSAVLFLENDRGGRKQIRDSNLAASLANIDPRPHLIFLSACASAATIGSAQHPMVGLAPKLVAAGIPAVVAMQDLIEMEKARQLAGDFYRRLSKHGLVDVALNEARNLLWSEGNQDWSFPALFMRLRDGQLFLPVAPATRYGVPYEFLDPPDHYIERPLISERLQEQLIAGRGSPAITLIHGMAASGKTTLARALAQAVWPDFPNGVLWVTLGQEPELLNLLVELIQELGDYDFRAATVDGASRHLARLLAELQVLLVLDDVWEYTDAAPFLSVGPRCHVLIISRRARLLSDHSRQPYRYRLRQLTENQSLEMLARLLDRETDPPFTPQEEAQALALADAVGHLPLALELASRRIADGSSSWQEMTTALKSEIADLYAPASSVQGRITGQLRLEASLNLSLRHLYEDSVAIWEFFIRLAVLPEDATISAPAAANLWQCSIWQARQILALLDDENLLLEAPELHVHDRRWPAYKLHDLVHDVIRRRLAAPKEPHAEGDLPGLGLTWRQAHAELLEHYRQLTTDGSWPTLPDDGYIQANLAWHLEQAGQDAAAVDTGR